jgi:hypothetical protein
MTAAVLTTLLPAHAKYAGASAISVDDDNFFLQNSLEN